MKKSIYKKEYKKVVDSLKKARHESGLTQAQVANKLGCHQSYISKIERMERRIDIIELKELAKIYKKQLDYFL